MLFDEKNAPKAIKLLILFLVFLGDTRSGKAEGSFNYNNLSTNQPTTATNHSSTNLDLNSTEYTIFDEEFVNKVDRILIGYLIGNMLQILFFLILYKCLVKIFIKKEKKQKPREFVLPINKRPYVEANDRPRRHRSRNKKSKSNGSGKDSAESIVLDANGNPLSEEQKARIAAWKEENERIRKQQKINFERDSNEANYLKMGKVYFPLEITDDVFKQTLRDPGVEKLDVVKYDPAKNERFFIGSEIDDFEIAPSSIDISTDDSEDDVPPPDNKPNTKPENKLENKVELAKVEKNESKSGEVVKAGNQETLKASGNSNKSKTGEVVKVGNQETLKASGNSNKSKTGEVVKVGNQETLKASANSNKSKAGNQEAMKAPEDSKRSKRGNNNNNNKSEKSKLGKDSAEKVEEAPKGIEGPEGGQK